MGQSEANCREVVEALFLYIDGEAAAEVCGGIELHLRRCAPCMDHVSFERDLKELVRRKCLEGGAPSDLTARLKDRLSSLLDDG
jgi:mycothiol system anti-sigma-R factor